MRISRLPALAVMAALALAPAANAMPQDLRSPDARDAAVRGHVGQDLRSPGARDAALAQEKYYSSYGKAAPAQRTVTAADDSSPWPAIAIGVALIVLVAGAVGVAVRTRRRPVPPVAASGS